MNEWHNAERHAEKAHQFYEAGQWAKALAELKRALAVNPDQSDWHFGMGLTLEAMQRYDEAIDSFEQVLRLRGEDPEVLFRLGVTLLRSERTRRAIAALERVAQLDPEFEPSYCYRIAAYAQVGDHDMAEQMFYLAQQITDECPQCYDHVAMSLAMRGDLDRAIWCWRRALGLDPHYPDAYGNLARVYWQQGQLDRASQLYVLQLREDPGDVDTLLQLGNLMVEMGKLMQAREKFSRVLEMDPTATDAYLHLGELSLRAGNTDLAEAELEMAGRLSSDHPGVHLALAQVAQRRGNRDLVRSNLLAELDRHGQNVTQTLKLGQMLIEQGLTSQSVRVLSPLIDGSADTPPVEGQQLATALMYRGVAWLAEGKTRQGVTQCRRSIRISPQNTQAMAHLVRAHLGLGQLRRASYWLRRGTRTRPQDMNLRRLRRRLFVARFMLPISRLMARVLGQFGRS